MQLRYEQLNELLANKPLAPIYFISGEEPLLIQMACDSIRNSAKKQGFCDRTVFRIEPGFNSHTLLTYAKNYGLFSEKQLLELHLTQSISESTAQVLTSYANDPPAHKLLLVTAGKLDRRTLQSSWFKHIDTVGVLITIWPLEGAQLARWITEHLATQGFKAEKDAVQCLIAATEGNLLASIQEIEKLSLYFALDTPTTLTSEVIMQALSDNARFDPFKLIDAALQGEGARCLRILARLKEEQVEPLLILWWISRECRQLAALAFQLNQGTNFATLFQNYPIWKRRQPLFRQVLQRYSLTHWHTLLKLAAHADQVTKGVTSGDIWLILQQLSLRLAGTEL